MHTFFYDVVFEYILRHPNLTPNEKLVWLMIEKRARHSSDLACRLTCQQIGGYMNISPKAAYRLVRKLKQKEFMNLYIDQQIVTYLIALPEEEGCV